MSPFSPMIRTLASVVCAVALGWLHLAAMAAETNRIEAINVAGQQGGQVLVKITMSQPLANPPAVKPGTLMPNLNMSPQEIADLNE